MGFYSKEILKTQKLMHSFRLDITSSACHFSQWAVSGTWKGKSSKTKEEGFSPQPDFLGSGLNPQNLRNSGLGPWFWGPSGLWRPCPRLGYPGSCQIQSLIFPARKSPVPDAVLAGPNFQPTQGSLCVHSSLWPLVLSSLTTAPGPVFPKFSWSLLLSLLKHLPLQLLLAASSTV